MIEKDPMINDLRAALRERREPEGVCVMCGGEIDIEMHHPPGRQHSDDPTTPTCTRCHGPITEGQRRAGVRFEATSNLLDRLMSALRSLGDFFVRLGVQLMEWAEGLGGVIRYLDTMFPTWRDALPDPA